MFRFANPAALQLLWIVPVIMMIAWVFERRATAQMRKAFGTKLAPFLTASYSRAKRRLKIYFWCMAMVCYIIAMARPQTGRSQDTIKSEGVELMIAIDVSNSMLAEDVKPSRLEYAKSEISKLLDMLGGDKVGLIAFAGSATLLSPLTTDKAALKMFLDGLSPKSVENQGTDFKKALSEAKAAFEHGGVDPDEGVKVTRVVLLASDGEDNEPGATDEAKKLASDGIRIFSLAFGTERGAPIPDRDERGYLRGYKKDRSGHEVITQVKGSVLKGLAQAGQGSFYHATFGGQEAKMVRADIDKLEKSLFASELSTNYNEKFQIFLILGLLFSFADLILGERKGTGRIWRGRFEVSAS